MSSPEKDEDSQFRCMLCDFRATSKAEIGDHFLTDHMDAYVSPIKEEPRPTEHEGDAEGEGEGAEKDVAEKEVKKEMPKPRGRPPKKRTTPKPIKKQPYYYVVELDEHQEREETEEEPQQLGRGMRRRKRSTPRHILRYELDDDEDDDEEYDHEAEEKIMPKKKIPAIVPLMVKEKNRRGRKPGRSSKSGDSQGAEDSKTKAYKKPPSKLPLSERVIEKILSDRVTEWYLKFQEQCVIPIICPFEGCKLNVTQSELSVHIQCHAANLEGFRCPVEKCDFMCPHWSNMRVHYRKEHEPTFYKLMCGMEGCTMVFPRIDQKSIQIHVTRKHLRPELYNELMSKDFDKSKYENYISAVGNERDDADETITEEIGDMGSGEEAGAVTVEISEVEIQSHGPEGELEVSMEGPRPKKRGRPLGSTKAAKLARIAAGEVFETKEKKDKKGRGRRPFQRTVSHVAFFCDVCGGKYKSEELVYEHKSQHYRDDNYTLVHCSECPDFSSREASDIREHVATFHKSLLHLHRCDSCHFSTNRYHDLKKHIQVHSGSKDYMCDKCGTCTTTAYNLRVHWRRYHAPESEKVIRCFACDYTCADNGILKEHIRSKHGLMVYGKDYDNARPLPTYACTQCDYIGRKKASLAYHMRIHTENRQYKCHICPYASKTKNNLLLHIRTHEGLQPLKCPECDFRGATNKIISEHVMCKHARVRPYTCKICGWTSSYHGNMWKHVETHRRELGEAMPDEPVSVISTEGHMVAAPLKAPTLKKRGSSSGTSPGGSSGRTPKMRGKRNRVQYEEIPTTVQVAVEQEVQHMHVQEDNGKDGVVIQIPVSSVLDTQTITLAEGISEEAAMGASVLSRLAQGGEITVREVQFLQHGDNQQQHHEMITYNVPPVAVTQQIIAAGGDMGHIISEHHYQAQQQQAQHEHQVQQQRVEQDREVPVEHHYQEAALQTVQVVTSQENGVPRAVTEQVVHAISQQQHHQEHPHQDHRGGAPDHNRDQPMVHQLIPMTLPHEAELVMSMMQAHHASVSQNQ